MIDRPCSALTAPTNGALSPPGPYSYQNQVTVTCNSGYKLNGVSPVTCKADGTWSNPIPTCTRTSGQCSALSAPTNGARTPPTGANFFGNTVTFTCNAGFVRNGAATVTCQSDGTWTNHVPTCRQIDTCSLNPCRNGGTCIDQDSGFQCACPAGYEGDRCQTERPIFGVGAVVGIAVGCLLGGMLLVGAVTLLILRCRSAKKKEHGIAEAVYEDVRTPGRAVSQRSETGSDVYSYPMAPLPVPPLPSQPSGHYQELRPAVYQSLQRHQQTTPQPQSSTGDRSAFTISHDFST
ncbi:E-selectin-like [Branchiostoma floridae x Branchiostoma japonicum]